MSGREELATDTGDVRQQVRALGLAAKKAWRSLLAAEPEQKNEVLRTVASRLTGDAAKVIEEANVLDMRDGEREGLTAALLDRLRIDSKRLAGVADAVQQIAEFKDPVGETVHEHTREDGLRISQVRAPLGLVGIIYESRPNVTADAAALCFKSGNAVMLRGGKEAFRTNRALASVFEEALVEHGFPPALVTLIPTVDRAASLAMIQLAGIVDLVIPRGGPSLIEFVTREARVPVIQHFQGVCHIYVDGDADLDAARDIVVNSKMQRVGVCNAAEALLVDRICAETFIPKVMDALIERGGEVRGDETVCRLDTRAVPATDEDWGHEYLAPIIAVRVVDGLDEAIDHVARYGSNHTEAIVTRSEEKARRWFREVDASALMWNASTRFNDGGELGLGAEIGISTTKIHAYGPMGLAELCTKKWIVVGDGHTRS